VEGDPDCGNEARRKASRRRQGFAGAGAQARIGGPITEKESTDPAITGAFQPVKEARRAAGRQAEFESRWDAAALKNYTEARQLAERALTAK
jgi:hypothetical protein